MKDADARKILESLEREGLSRVLVPTRIDGARAHCAGGDFINLASNDYLGLSADARLQSEFFESLPSRGRGFLMGAVSSRLLGGDNPAFGDFEDYLAEAYSEIAGA